MKEILQQYSLYNLWANEKLTDVISGLPRHLCTTTIVSSFSSLQLTLLHVWNAESIWWQRVNLVEPVQQIWNEKLSFDEVAGGLMAQSKQWAEWIEKSPEIVFGNEFFYKNLKKEPFRQPVFQVLIHLFNHGTYHRGQLVTMLRQLEVDNLPATDFIVWSRNKT